MDTKYIFSYYKAIKSPKIKRRPWWDIFGRDSIEYFERWERFTHYIDQNTADIITILSRKNFNNDLSHLIFGKEKIYNVQLEVDTSQKTQYIQTSTKC